MSKQLVALLVAGVALLAIACDDIPASVGFSLDPLDGGVILHGARCNQEELITNVRLTDTHGTSVRNLDRDKETVIWEVSFPDGTVKDAFKVGVLPEGAVELHAFSGLPPEERWIRAYVTTRDAKRRQVTSREAVPLYDLQRGRIRALGDQLSLGEWPDYVRGEICSDGGGLIGAPW